MSCVKKESKEIKQTLQRDKTDRRADKQIDRQTELHYKQSDYKEEKSLYLISLTDVIGGCVNTQSLKNINSIAFLFKLQM